MTMRPDPPRLLDANSAADPLLREVLRAASTGTPSRAQLEALALKVGTATATHASVSAATSTRWFLAKTSMAKVSVALLITGTAAWFGWSLQPASHAVQGERRAVSPQQQRSVEAEISAHAQPARATEIATRRESQTAPAPVLRLHEPVASTFSPGSGTQSRARIAWSKPTALAVARSRRAVALDPASRPAAHAGETRPPTIANAQRASSTPTAAHDAPSELTLLSRAQGLLARDPQGALAVIEQHALAYPQGRFSEEREALAIDALHRLERNRALQARARAFLRRYPDSPHRERVEAWLR